MDAGQSAVADFIIQMAITAYNRQYGAQLNWQQYQIISIQPNIQGRCAFEITDLTDQEDFKLHIYSRLDVDNKINPYRLCDEHDYPAGQGEKVYVATATFNNEVLYLNHNEVRRECPTFLSPEAQLNCIIDENFITAIGDENNDYILYEDGTPLTGA